MGTPPPRRRRHWVAVAAIAPVVIVLILVSGLFQWSPLNCRHEDVDVRSGRVRHTRYLLYCRVGERVEETWLSRNATPTRQPPDWRRVNTFSPGVHYSPHYAYHGAIYQIETLEGLDAGVAFDPDARRKVADHLLQLWQKTGSYFGADNYIDAVARVAGGLATNGGKTVNESDLPDG